MTFCSKKIMKSYLQVGDIGLENTVKFVNKNALNFNKRYMLIDGKLFCLPTKLIDLFVPRKPFSPFILYGLKDLITKQIDLSSLGDISVDTFFKYRFGQEIVDYLINPLCIGISGGNSKTLSMKSMFPNLLRKEQTFGSVVRGMFAKEDIYKDLINHWLVEKSINQKWAVFSFDRGIQTLSEAIISHLQKNYMSIIELMPNNEAIEITFNNADSVEITVEQIKKNISLNLQVDHIFASIPAFKLSSILGIEKHEKLKHALQSIPTVNMALVSFLFDQNVIPDHLAGFGFLVPSIENSAILGVTFDSCIFPNVKGTKLTVKLV